MERQAEAIRKFSKVVYILLSIFFVVFIVLGAMGLLMTTLWLPTEVVTIGERSVEVPYLFKLNDFTVLLPVFVFDGPISVQNLRATMPVFEFDDLLRIVLTVVVLGFAKDLFRLLRDDGSPFREDVVRAFRRLAIALLCIGLVTGVVGFLAAGIVWVLCLIFDYGRLLQDESDTTL